MGSYQDVSHQSIANEQKHLRRVLKMTMEGRQPGGMSSRAGEAVKAPTQVTTDGANQSNPTGMHGSAKVDVQPLRESKNVCAEIRREKERRCST